VAKQQRVDFCTELRQLVSDDKTFLPRVITGYLAPCDFFLFLKMKWKLKGRRFDTIEEIQVESQTVRISRKRSKKGGGGGTGVYMREVTTSRVMTADGPYGEFYDFYSVSPEYFGYHLVWKIISLPIISKHVPLHQSVFLRKISYYDQ
jgi:hypothetical protein